MKKTGIIRRIDDLGRVVIPKSIRESLGIHENDFFEIGIDGENVIFTRYVPEPLQKEKIAEQWAKKNSLNLYQSRYTIDCTTIHCEAIVCGNRRTGTAKLAVGDKFSPIVGMVIANCRATGRKIPKELLE